MNADELQGRVKRINRRIHAANTCYINDLKEIERDINDLARDVKKVIEGGPKLILDELGYRMNLKVLNTLKETVSQRIKALSAQTEFLSNFTK